MRQLFALLVVASVLCGTDVFAEADSQVTAAQQANVKSALEKISKTTGRPVTASNIKTTPISGLLQVTADASVFYVSTDGNYVVAGEMLDVNSDLENWSLTEKAMRDLRLQLLATLPEKDLIIFPATAPKIGTVTVFTDIDCSYCQQMHAHIEEYNDLGIEIRYAAFPRSGPGTKSFDKAITVWCSTDRLRDLTLAKQHKDLTMNLCANNPVEMEFELGKKLGVSGTPTVFFSNGAKIPGYIPPQQLKEILTQQ